MTKEKAKEIEKRIEDYKEMVEYSRKKAGEKVELCDEFDED